MMKNNVWNSRGSNHLSTQRRGSGSKRVFAIKRNGVYQARLVAKGYNQILGIDFQYNFAPMTSDVTMRVLLVVWIVLGYHAETSDVQTAFLYGDLKQTVFLLKPDGWDIFANENGLGLTAKYMKLNKTIYRLVQAARAWWRKLMVTLKQHGFTVFANDNCLVKRRQKKEWSS